MEGPVTHVLVRGTKSETVSTLKYWLNLVVTPNPSLSANRDFDQPTFDAVVKFQIVQGLHPDGKVGADTWFGVLNQSQVEGLEHLLAFIELDPDVTDIRWGAYMMAAVKWECADTWQPIEEGGKGAGH
jgi:Putative peptidoglycan binding domain